jgi:hypothetical protein
MFFEEYQHNLQRILSGVKIVVIGGAVVGLVLLAGVLVWDHQQQARSPSPISEKAFPGLCYNAGSLFSPNAPVKSCTQPHNGEVVSIERIPANIILTYSTFTTLSDSSLTVIEGICQDDIDSYLGSSASSNGAFSRPDNPTFTLQQRPLYPDQQDWGKGERWLVCTVVEGNLLFDPPMTASIKGEG